MKRQKIYLSGPMTDKKTGRVSNDNLKAFEIARELLQKEGYERIKTPTNVWVCRWPWLYRLMERLMGREIAYRLVLLYDILVMLRCDYIYKMPGWRESRGAQVESCVAFHMGLWLIHPEERERVDKKLARRMEKYAAQCAALKNKEEGKKNKQ